MCKRCQQKQSLGVHTLGQDPWYQCSDCQEEEEMKTVCRQCVNCNKDYFYGPSDDYCEAYLNDCKTIRKELASKNIVDCPVFKPTMFSRFKNWLHSQF